MKTEVNLEASELRILARMLTEKDARIAQLETQLALTECARNDNQKRIAELESILYNKLPNYLNRKRMNTPPLDRTPIPQEIYRDYIAGVQFGQYKEAYADNALHVGDVLKLVWERSNQYDPNAVAIYTADGKYRLGYIKKIDTRLLHDFRTRNIKLSAYLHECDFTAKPWQMFAVRITAPNIIRTSSDPDLEF